MHTCSAKLIPKNVDHIALEEHFRRSCGGKPIDQSALDLLKQMLSLDPAKRPSAAKCLQHPYFTDPNNPIQQMTDGEFLNLTQNLKSCHEYSIKQRERKRGRGADEAGGMCLTALHLCTDIVLNAV